MNSTEVSRILLVDDDPDQVQLFKLILTTVGYEVLAVPDAALALARLADTPVALLLADWSLPGTKGDALIAIVKARYPAVKTVLFSNHAYVDEAASAVGADAWFRKMDDTLSLRELIGRLLTTQG